MLCFLIFCGFLVHECRVEPSFCIEKEVSSDHFIPANDEWNDRIEEGVFDLQTHLISCTALQRVRTFDLYQWD